ncbi:asparagine synthase (glutamine-hydrolyzing) [Pseudomonas sp. SWI6]|uniref:asparagine synthase (glutamine-hydrolyzing) n=1 Tax=Pseudomonas TaxID=286 RepID=UPI000CE5F8D6|nr:MULTISPECIES: asparagine synthase (glutamine-hydrolyzing) [Pseudomonas]AVD84311.1 asparagine synthase (glutamine-hydrolyzing) [Pseudomonas sp. SWI6]MDT8922060.1 asparagine synthase (glutamine-hydrolyzing) [Pseudomonas taiwanensis]
MCGFVGSISHQPIGRDVLERMGAAIAHRGPDAAEIWLDEQANYAVVHRRLAVVDLSDAGAQPMHSACGRFVLAFNGEIYNHLELRKALAQSGDAYTWRGHSDTETLLACFVAWGVKKTLKSAVGMFAISLWDRAEKTLTLARDRIGEKPLYWGWQGTDLLFGSELKALRAHPSFKADIDRDALASFVRFNYIPAPFSIYKGIEKFKPGCFVTIDFSCGAASAEVQTYWSMNEVVARGLDNQYKGSQAEAISTLESALTQSITDQMLADVPLGALLSGGVDSSVVVALMQKISVKPVKTFTIGFAEKGFNEAEQAKAVAKHLGTDHTELYVGASEALEVIPKLASIYCEPFADSSQIPTFIVSRLARQDVTVALSGDGGDEIFGGYNPYQFAPKIWKGLSSIPMPLRKLAGRISGALPLPEKIGKLFALSDQPTREAFYLQLVSHWKDTSGIVLGSSEHPSAIARPDTWPKVDDFVPWMMAMDSQSYMVDDVLLKVDRASMANSLETRIPILDHRVIELAWRLPMEMKIRDGKGKWILRETLYQHVPRELIERPKKGFSIPLGQWLRGPLREWAESLLDSNLLRQQGYFDSAGVRKVWEFHLSGKADCSRQLWSILMFQAWYQEQAC